MTSTRESLVRVLRPTADTRTLLLRAAIASACCVLVARSATATVVGGGGNQATDCLTVFDAPVNDPASKPRNVRCVDGDSCDADGTVNGVCEFALAVCANSTFDPACGLNGVQSIKVEHSADNGDPKFDPQFQALNVVVRTLFTTEIRPDVGRAITVRSQLSAANGDFTVYNVVHDLMTEMPDGPWETVISATPTKNL